LGFSDLFDAASCANAEHDKNGSLGVDANANAHLTNDNQPHVEHHPFCHLILLLQIIIVLSDFFYSNFNQTTGLIFNMEHRQSRNVTKLPSL